MDELQIRFASSFKGIIYICICAFIIAGTVTHQFDPFHPKLVTRECIQAPLLCSDDLKWFSVAVIGLFLIRHLSNMRRLQQTTHGLPKYKQFVQAYIRPTGHPILAALRRGRLQRLTYH